MKSKEMKQPKIIVAGIGPGNEQDITPAVKAALHEADAVIGYKYYFQFITPYLHPETPCIDTGMKRERVRANRLSNWQSRERRYASSVRAMQASMA